MVAVGGLAISENRENADFPLFAVLVLALVIVEVCKYVSEGIFAAIAYVEERYRDSGSLTGALEVKVQGRCDGVRTVPLLSKEEGREQ